jgi:hypothetical protein
MIYQAGDVVLEEEPIVSILNVTYKFIRCDFCFESL